MTLAIFVIVFCGGLGVYYSAMLIAYAKSGAPRTLDDPRILKPYWEARLKALQELTP